MISLNLKPDWNNRTCAYVCPECKTRIQALGKMVYCKCGKIGVGGNIYSEVTVGMPTEEHYKFSVER